MLLKKLFSGKAFYITVFLLYSLSVLTSYLVVQRINNLRQIEELKLRTLHRWYDYNMREFCEQAELLNANIRFKCPDVDKIIEGNKYNDD